MVGKSEGPAQVFLIVLVCRMIAALGKLTREEREKVVV